MPATFVEIPCDPNYVVVPISAATCARLGIGERSRRVREGGYTRWVSAGRVLDA